MSTFSRKPAGLESHDVEAFIEGAERRTAEQLQPPQPPKELPWEAPNVRKDLLKTFNLRLPEPYHYKLAYIAEHTPHSMHDFCMDVLQPAIDAKIEELIEKSEQ